MGVSATSVLMSVMYFATTFCASDSLGVTAASISEFGGMPRSALSMSAAAGSFANQLIQAIAASGILGLGRRRPQHACLVPGLPVGCLAGRARAPQHLHQVTPPAAALTASS